MRRYPSSSGRVAARVLAAIREDELYVFTPPEMHAGVKERFATIQTAMNKVR